MDDPGRGRCGRDDDLAPAPGFQLVVPRTQRGVESTGPVARDDGRFGRDAAVVRDAARGSRRAAVAAIPGGSYLRSPAFAGHTRATWHAHASAHTVARVVVRTTRGDGCLRRVHRIVRRGELRTLGGIAARLGPHSSVRRYRGDRSRCRLGAGRVANIRRLVVARAREFHLSHRSRRSRHQRAADDPAPRHPGQIVRSPWLPNHCADAWTPAAVAGRPFLWIR